LLSPSEVSAVIVTKGDVDLTPVIESLIFPLICVYNNSTEDTDQMTYGRVVAAQRAPTDVIWSQDDDIIHTPEAQREIVAAYEPGVLTGCMWPEWSAGANEQGIENGYDDLVFPGSGSISDVKVWEDAVSDYLVEWPDDEFFLLWCDTIIGVIAPTKQLDIRFQVLPCAEDETRMCNLPDAVELKTEAIMRARAVRDKVAAACVCGEINTRHCSVHGQGEVVHA
jgi:hypothetical protein